MTTPNTSTLTPAQRVAKLTSAVGSFLELEKAVRRMGALVLEYVQHPDAEDAEAARIALKYGALYRRAKASEKSIHNALAQERSRALENDYPTMQFRALQRLVCTLEYRTTRI